MAKTSCVPVVCLLFGYEEDFVSPVEEDFQCSICHLPLREPVLTRCGHRFCRQCLEELLGRQKQLGQPFFCIMDRKELTYEKDVFPDKATERKIQSLIVKCPSEGCEWTNELRDKENHLTLCPFKVVPCANNNCQVTAVRKELEEHVTNECQWRIIECLHCSEPHTATQYYRHCLKEELPDQEHTEECKKLPIECPNNCTATKPREEIPSHVNDDCPLSVIVCPYVEVGCNTKVQRRHLEAHFQSATRTHLDLACLKLNRTQEEFKQTTRNLEEKVDKLQERQKKDLELLQGMAVNLQGQEREISRLKNESAPFIWKITGFNRILYQAKRGRQTIIKSNPFFTGTNGYKMMAYMYPNGCEIANYVSVFIYISKGKYDAVLPWPFGLTVKITLIDQQDDPRDRKNVVRQFVPDPNNKCFQRPVEDESNTGNGYSRFVSHMELRTRRYQEDDTLFLQIQTGSSS